MSRRTAVPITSERAPLPGARLVVPARFPAPAGHGGAPDPATVERLGHDFGRVAVYRGAAIPPVQRVKIEEVGDDEDVSHLPVNRNGIVEEPGEAPHLPVPAPAAAAAASAPAPAPAPAAAAGFAMRLNLGAGSNPLTRENGFNINLDLAPPSPAALGTGRHHDSVLADATRPPFRSGVFDEVHAVNPYGYNPLSSGVSRVMAPGGTLHVSGTKANKYAKNTGSARVDPAAAGLQPAGEGALIPEHQYGQQRTTDGGALDVQSSRTRTYVPLPAGPAAAASASAAASMSTAAASTSAAAAPVPITAATPAASPESAGSGDDRKGKEKEQGS